MIKLAKLIGMTALALSPLPAMVPAAAQTTVQVKTTMVVVAMIGTGDAAAKAKFEGAAKIAGLSTSHSTGRDGQDEVMVFVSRTADPALFWIIFRGVQAGKFGALRLTVALAPTDANPDAKDYLDKVLIYQADQIVDPGK